ncbi:hypothetical protein THAOC_09059 [Thalassiosira oceanica]|uniref:Uncharacterized protein n=1 Tax=Thalassiosira oceanica TaxID=159749 RepID=K0T8K4_THAOC|nr:hypothetical protein THAOC_09059 [Thalassiosira oceanica]|eukprot:EJK69661.1 hypothetical protein THAOC_09059 [Thalassiosira oceanica]
MHFIHKGLSGRCCSPYIGLGLFFPEWTARGRSLAYDTNKTCRAEAPFGPAGDDNRRRYEPPPWDRIGLATAVVPSRRRPPAALGKPSFPCFKVYYLPRRRMRFEPSPLDMQWPESEDWGRPPRLGEDASCPRATILAVKRTSYVQL